MEGALKAICPMSGMGAAFGSISSLSTSPSISRCTNGAVTAFEYTLMDFLKSPMRLVVSYRASMNPLPPGGIESRVQSGVVHPHEVCTCWINSVLFPVLVKGYLCDANFMDSAILPKL